MSDQIHYYYECQCHSDEHRIIWWMDDGRDIDWEPMLGFSVFLPDYPKFWSRIWNAIKYIFGYKSKYGHFDSFLMKPEDIDNMVSMLLNFKEEQRKYTFTKEMMKPEPPKARVIKECSDKAE